MSEITTKETSKNELIISNSDLSMVEELLVSGKTLTEIFSDQKAASQYYYCQSLLSNLENKNKLFIYSAFWKNKK